MHSVAVAERRGPQPPVERRVDREAERGEHGDREERRLGVAVAEREVERPVGLEHVARVAAERAR